MIDLIIPGFFLVSMVAIFAALINFQGERDAKARAAMDERMQVERQDWAEERRQLLERIQRPEHQPAVYTADPPPTPEPLDMDMALVGTVVSEATDDGE